MKGELIVSKKKEKITTNRNKKLDVENETKIFKGKNFSKYIANISGIVTIISLIAIPQHIIEYYLLKGMHSYLGLENLLFTIKWDFREYWNQSISSILFILLLIGLSYYVNIQWQKYKSQAGLPWKIGLVLFVIFVLFIIFIAILYLLLGYFYFFMSLIYACYTTFILFVFVLSDYVVSLFQGKDCESDKNSKKSSKKKRLINPIVISIIVPITIGCAVVIALSVYLNFFQSSFVEQGKDIMKSEHNYSFVDIDRDEEDGSVINKDKYILFETINNEKIIIKVKLIKNNPITYQIVEKGTYQYLTDFDNVKVRVQECVIDNGDE